MKPVPVTVGEAPVEVTALVHVPAESFLTSRLPVVVTVPASMSPATKVKAAWYVVKTMPPLVSVQ